MGGSGGSDQRPKRSPRGPKRPQEGPKKPQEAPKRPQEAPKRLQEAPKGSTRDPQEVPKRPGKVPKAPKREAKTSKSRFPNVSLFHCIFATHFFYFLDDLASPRTSKIVLPCTRELNFQKIVLLAVNTDF